MSQTKNAKHKKNKRVRAYLIYEYTNNIGISLETFAEKADITVGQLNGVLNATTKNPPLNVLTGICKVLGVTLDYFCYNSNENTFETETYEKLGILKETADWLEKNKEYKVFISNNKKPQNINKKDYNAILNLLLESKIPMGIGTKSFIEIFNTNVLNLLISTIIYDKTFMENFKENFHKLSSTINSNKTKTIGKTDIDMTFNEIFNSAKIQKIYRNATNELHDAIDGLLKITLKETFDSIKSDSKLL